MNQYVIAIPFAVTVTVLVLSLVVRTRFIKACSLERRRRVGEISSSVDLAERITSARDLPEVEVRQGGSAFGGSYHLKDYITVPNAPEWSALSVAVVAHELAHLEQKESTPLLAGISTYLGIIGNYLSYLFVPFLAVGFLFYWPLVPAGLITYLIIVALALLEVPLEMDASRRALGYLREYGDFDGSELNRLKGLLRLAILTRITILTIGFLDLIYTRGD